MASEHTQELIEEIRILIRARYPLLYLVTWEEKRVEAILAEVAKSRNKGIFSWTITQGMTNLEMLAAAPKRQQEQTQDPIAALDYIEKYQQAAIFIPSRSLALRIDSKSLSHHPQNSMVSMPASFTVCTPWIKS